MVIVDRLERCSEVRSCMQTQEVLVWNRSPNLRYLDGECEGRLRSSRRLRLQVCPPVSAAVKPFFVLYICCVCVCVCVAVP